MNHSSIENSSTNARDVISGCLDKKLQRPVAIGDYYHTDDCSICLCSPREHLCKQISCAPPVKCEGFIRPDPLHCCDICYPAILDRDDSSLNTRSCIMILMLFLVICLILFLFRRMRRKRVLITLRNLQAVRRIESGYSSSNGFRSIGGEEGQMLSPNSYLNFSYPVTYTVPLAPPSYASVIQVSSGNIDVRLCNSNDIQDSPPPYSTVIYPHAENILASNEPNEQALSSRSGISSCLDVIRNGRLASFLRRTPTNSQCTTTNTTTIDCSNNGNNSQMIMDDLNSARNNIVSDTESMNHTRVVDFDASTISISVSRTRSRSSLMTAASMEGDECDGSSGSRSSSSSRSSASSSSSTSCSCVACGVSPEIDDQVYDIQIAPRSNPPLQIDHVSNVAPQQSSSSNNTRKNDANDNSKILRRKLKRKCRRIKILAKNSRRCTRPASAMAGRRRSAKKESVRCRSVNLS